MARRQQRRYRARLNRKRRHPRHNLYSPGPLVNRVHKRRTIRARARAFFRRHFRRRHSLKANRHYRRNPSGLSLAGIQFPPLDAVLWVGAGVIVPPMVTAQVMKFIPVTWQQSAATTWLVKVASVVVPGILLRRFVNPRAGNLFMVGGLATLVVDAIRTYAPGMIPGLSYQPLLGTYFTPDAAAQRPRAALPPMIAEAPTRLDPQHRF